MPLTTEFHKYSKSFSPSQMREDHKENEEILSTPAQVVSRSTEARLADALSVAGIPKSVTINDIKAIHQENFSSDGPIHLGDLSKAIERGDLDSMGRILAMTLANEASEGEYHYKFRQTLETIIKDMETGYTGNSVPLYTVEIYGKWELTFPRTDRNFGFRMTNLAKGLFTIFPGELVPGTGRKWEGKHAVTVPIVGGYLLRERQEVMADVKKQLLQEKLEKVDSDTIAQRFGTHLAEYEARALEDELSKGV